MSGDQIGQLFYLILLLVAVAGWLVAESRGNLGRVMRQAAAWGLLFIGTIAAFGLWSDIRDDLVPRQTVVGAGRIEVPRGPDGHYHLVLDLNGRNVQFVVDTGASDVVLTRRDAQRIGLDLDRLVFSGTASTANGIVRTAPAVVDEVRLGDIVDRRVPVSVNAGAMDGSLLGMSYLQKFRKIEIEAGRLLLTR